MTLTHQNPRLPLPFTSFSHVLRQIFGCRVHKISLHAGLTCPNRDGTRGYGGCTFCDNTAFSTISRCGHLPLTEQLAQGFVSIHRRYHVDKFIAYFQTYSNTWAPLEHLRQLYDTILPYEQIVGLAVGTRPDCITAEIVECIARYCCDTRVVWIELGLQSMHERTLKLINRGHGLPEFERAIALISPHPIRICVHIIIGLPGETRDDILKTADYCATLPIHELKIHPLHVLKGTELHKQYQQRSVTPMTFSEYISLLADFLERIPERIAIQRLSADADLSSLIAPAWLGERRHVNDALIEEFRRRGTKQGSMWQPSLARKRNRETTGADVII